MAFVRLFYLRVECSWLVLVTFWKLARKQFGVSAERIEVRKEEKAQVVSNE